MRGHPVGSGRRGRLPGQALEIFSAPKWPLKGLRDEDAAIRLLAGLEEGDVNAGQRGAGAVEGVAEAVFAFGVLEAEVEPAGLEILEIGATGDFEVGVLAGSPDLDVVGFGAAEAEVAGAKLDDAVMEAEELEHLLGIGGERFEFRVGGLRGGELDQLDLVELMDADEAAGAEAGRPGLAAEAGRVGDEILRQIGEREDFLAVEVGDGHLGGGGEVELVALAAVKLLLELGQLAGADERLAADDEGRADLRGSRARGCGDRA